MIAKDIERALKGFMPFRQLVGESRIVLSERGTHVVFRRGMEKVFALGGPEMVSVVCFIQEMFPEIVTAALAKAAGKEG